MSAQNTLREKARLALISAGDKRIRPSSSEGLTGSSAKLVKLDPSASSAFDTVNSGSAESRTAGFKHPVSDVTRFVSVNYDCMSARPAPLSDVLRTKTFPRQMFVYKLKIAGLEVSTDLDWPSVTLNVLCFSHDRACNCAIERSAATGSSRTRMWGWG